MNKLRQAQQILMNTQELIDKLQQEEATHAFKLVRIQFTSKKAFARAMLDRRTFTLLNCKVEYMWTDNSGFIAISGGKSRPMQLSLNRFNDIDLHEICVK